MPRKNRKSSFEVKVPTEGKMAVSKMDAAVRQLETAIDLWFYDKDAVSIAALAHAGYQVIYDINLQKKAATMNALTGKGMIREEYQKEYETFARATPNFLKHGFSDPNETHYFSPEISPLLMLEALVAYEKLTKLPNPVFRTFYFWFILEHPQLMTEESRPFFSTIDANAQLEFLRAGKKAYYEQALPVFRKAISAGLPLDAPHLFATPPSRRAQ